MDFSDASKSSSCSLDGDWGGEKRSVGRRGGSRGWSWKAVRMAIAQARASRPTLYPGRANPQYGPNNTIRMGRYKHMLDTTRYKIR